MKCIVIIPAFNEEKSLPLVLKEIPKDLVEEIIVVDNGSSDSTAKIAQDNGAIVVYEPQKGYGKACLTGIDKSREFNSDVIAFLDGDFSDNPSELRLLIDKVSEGYDLVIGSRTILQSARSSLLPQARFGNWLSTGLMKMFFGGAFTDLGPFRLIKRDALQLIDMKDEDFGWTVEMQVKALIYDLKCAEIPVSYKKRVGVSKITGTFKGTILAGYKILSTIGKLYVINFFKKRKQALSRNG